MTHAKLNKILSVIAVSLFAFIFIATIVFYIVSREKHGIFWNPNPAAEKITNMSAGSEKSMDAFTDIGQLRIFTRQTEEDAQAVVVVVSPWFSYPSEDKALFEELSLKERQIKAIFTNYFSALTFPQIKSKGEKTIKEELLQKINENLVMGKIRAVYFNDYIFIE
ncbi:flagellar basal body-associated FliL family protein [Treponema sp.]|uniref:flagellar basal body-associated FliL family protein n=1 Tax=Treponema sp. TaxID=166 RepID=UPI003F09781E